MIRLQIESPTGNTRSPIHMEALLRTIHRANPRRHPLTLAIQSNTSGVSLEIECGDELRSLFVQELQDAYPGTNVRWCDPEPIDSREALSLRKTPEAKLIRTWESFVDDTDQRQLADPLLGLLSAVRCDRQGQQRKRVELTLRPASRGRVRSVRKMIGVLGTGRPVRWLQTTYVRCAQHDRLLVRLLGWLISLSPSGKTQRPQFGTELPLGELFECHLVLTTVTTPNSPQNAKKSLFEIAGVFGRFNTEETQFVSTGRQTRRGFTMSPAEIATVWHPLTTSIDGTSGVVRSTFREIEPPAILTSKEGSESVTILGRTKYRRERRQFGIRTDDLSRHVIVTGKTGCGKSTFLQSVVEQQIRSEHGAILIDPHGQLASDVLNIVPKHRTNDVVFFDAADNVAPVCFNPMVGPANADPTLIADGVLTSFKNVFGFDAGSAPRLLHILRNCLLTLIGTPHASINSVQRLLVDAQFRKSSIASVKNNAVREFWLTEFNRWNERDRTQYIASLQNKLGALTTNERVQRILSGGQKGIVLRELMDHSKILVCNLSKGNVGHDASTLLGSLLLSSLQIAAMSRADIPESQRRNCTVVIDEFHSYLAEGNTTMADALAESRKYRTSYVLSTQLLEQMDAATLAGVLGNCGSAMCMTVGPRDAEVLGELLGAGLTPEDLMRLPKYHAYLRMLIDGTAHTFSMTTLPGGRAMTGRAEIIRRLSRQRYGYKQTA